MRNLGKWLPCVALAAISAYATAAPADESSWVPITKNAEGTIHYSGRKGSYEVVQTKGGDSIAVIIGQTDNKQTKGIKFSKWYVKTDDCAAGFGQLVILKINGDFDFDSDFVADGNSVASGVADFICDLYREDQKARQARGI